MHSQIHPEMRLTGLLGHSGFSQVDSDSHSFQSDTVSVTQQSTVLNLEIYIDVGVRNWRG